MTGQQLKNSILQMAVQGKLVPQDPNDEPASVLLERIRAEKEQLIKEGKIKKEKNPSIIFRGADNLPYEKVGKNEPVCIADEVPFDIPESWEWVRLQNICNIVSARRVHQSDWKSSGIPFYRAREIGVLADKGKVDDDLFVSEELYNDFAKSGVPHPGDLMVTAVGTLGKVYVVQPQDRFYYKDASVICLENFGRIIPEYLQLVMMSPYMTSLIKSKSTGTTVGTITIVCAKQYLIPIPPLNEQRKIVKRLGNLKLLIESYAEEESALSKLNTQFPEILKKSILQYAVQGKLVPQDPADEPASVLLERIRTEKEKLIKAGKIKRDKHESVIFRRDNSYYEVSGKNEVCIDDEILFDIPESWEWTRLGNVLASTDAGKSPQCEDRSCNKGEAGVIKTTAVQDGYFLPNENKVLPTSFTIQKDQLIRKGDLLITRAGPRNRTGVLCVVDVECEKLILSDKTVRLAYIRNNVNPHYLQIALSSPAIQNMVVKAMSGMAESQVNISQSNMKKFLIPIPPLNEQNRIVDKYKTVYSAFVNKFEFLL